MRTYRQQVAVLGMLHELPEAERELAFRQGMASLAQVASDPASVPFAGLDTERLLESVRVVLAAPWLDDLSFLSGPSAACTLYALASALPSLSAERREVGRRVLGYLQHGDAGSFLALAGALALGSTKPFSGPTIRARVQLLLQVPASAGVSMDSLAFSLCSRRELFTRFVAEPTLADLPARRAAARLLERAARYAALRAEQGDDGELRVFEAPHVESALAQLLADREPFVSRHAASARGLLSVHVARHAAEIEHDLADLRSLSRARRGATSLAACVAVRPAQALARARELLESPASARDPGLCAALIHGLPQALEVEPEAAEQLLVLTVERGGLLSLEALLELRRELHDPGLCPAATDAARLQVPPSGDGNGDESGQLEPWTMLHDALERTQSPHVPTLPDLSSEALWIAAHQGPLAARDAALQVLERTRQEVERLALLDASQGRRARREMLRVYHELSLTLLHSSWLFDLLCVSGAPPESLGALCGLYVRLLDLLRTQEAEPHPGGPIAHPAVRMRRLRMLVHLLDADFRPTDELTPSVREVRLSALRTLCGRIAQDTSSAMDRIVHAALARGLDALVRAEVLELADVLLCVAGTVPLSAGVLTLVEGCLLPDLKRALRALFGLMQALEETHVERARVALALDELAGAIASDDSPRTEALRRALVALARALEAMLAARSIRELVRSRRALTLFEDALSELAYLVSGARRRIGLGQQGAIIDESPVAGLARALESEAAQGGLQDLSANLDWLARELVRTLPGPLARAIACVLETLRDFPLDAPDAAVAPLASAGVEACPMPPWVHPSRRLGGFYLVRPLGAGLSSTAFIVKRIEERDHEAAPRLVLKVPRYDASAARALTEASFEDAFARELPALLSVAPHENLASFVSVWTERTPKPFVVTELIDGPTLARVRKRKLDPRCVLDGILAGLEALHAVGIGHLGVTPDSVILRLRGGVPQPVLVDFGLAGRHVRPGCGHAAYAAPELWSGAATTPMAMDVYAVGCIAYELLTGRPLFHGVVESQLAAAHASHDGAPSGLDDLSHDPRTAPFVPWIALCVRHDPGQRAGATALRHALRTTCGR